MKAIKSIDYKKGFTLIELVLVIAIIGILATMVVPRYTGITEDAKAKADLASARTIASAVSIAIQEIDNIGTLKSEHIEKYLSNIKVEVGIQVSNGWSVLLDSDENGNFTIYKDRIEIFPESEANSPGGL